MPDKLTHFRKYSNILKHSFSNAKHRSICSNSEYSVLILLIEIFNGIRLSESLASPLRLSKFCWWNPTLHELDEWVALPCRSVLKKGFASSC